MEPSDFLGIPYPKEGETIWLRPRILPNPERDDGKGVMFFDDVPQSYPAVMNALSQIVLDNKAGVHEIAEGWRNYVLAGNEMGQRAATYEMPSHLRGRLYELRLVPTLDDWKEWAYKNKIRDEVISFLNFAEGGFSADKRVKVNYARLFNFDFTNPSKAKASPRGWEMVSEALNMFDKDDELLQAFVTGAIGDGPATEFIGFLKVWKDLPDPDDVLSGKDIVPNEPSSLIALIGAIVARYAKDPSKYATRVLEYSNLLKPEFSVLLVKDAYKANKQITTSKGWRAWADKYGNLIL
jgi:hypothetical protein